MLTNAGIEEARKNGEIEITHFDPEHLGLYYYILTPDKVIAGIKSNSDGVLDNTRTVDLTDYPFPIAPGQNVTVVFKEQIILSKKYYGAFFSCSFCIESGLQLTFGEIEPEYNGELRIGVTNMRDYEFVLRSKYELAKVRFEKFPEDACFLTLPAQREAHKERIKYLRGEREELLRKTRKTQEDLKKIDDQLREISVW
jgi:deoxycytidine triphosphate deaminase